MLWLNVKKISPLFTNTYALVTNVNKYLSTSPYSKGHQSCRQVFLPLTEIFLFSVPPVASFVGASDIDLGFHRPETGDKAQE